MNKKYKILDLNNGLLSEHVEVYASSPANALKTAGYKNIERDYTGKRGNVIVYGLYYRGGSYVYFAN